jgi:transcriptional regulator with XRE-family HTH domain
MNQPDRDQLRRVYGSTLRTLRSRAGYAQERFALDAGVDRSYLGKLERGEATPTLETVYRFLPLLRISFVEFATEFESALRRDRRTRRRPPAPPESG